MFAFSPVGAGSSGSSLPVSLTSKEMNVMVGDRVRVLYGSEKGKYGAPRTAAEGDRQVKGLSKRWCFDGKLVVFWEVSKLG